VEERPLLVFLVDLIHVVVFANVRSDGSKYTLGGARMDIVDSTTQNKVPKAGSSNPDLCQSPLIPHPLFPDPFGVAAASVARWLNS
jgi:hypothetical protein